MEKEMWAGYNVVLENRGPARAREVTLDVYARCGEEPQRLDLVDVYADEFPIRQLDAGARYPIRFVDRSQAWRTERWFEARLTWRDGRRGLQERKIAIRRGQTAA